MKIELGITEQQMPTCAAEEVGEKTHVSYPSMYIRSDKPIDLPEGEFTFVATGKVISRTERTESKGDDDDEPTERCDYEVEIYSIDPKGGGSDKETDVGSALRSAAKKKMEEKAKEY